MRLGRSIPPAGTLATAASAAGAVAIALAAEPFAPSAGPFAFGVALLSGATLLVAGVAAMAPSSDGIGAERMSIGHVTGAFWFGASAAVAALFVLGAGWTAGVEARELRPRPSGVGVAQLLAGAMLATTVSLGIVASLGTSGPRRRARVAVASVGALVALIAGTAAAQTARADVHRTRATCHGGTSGSSGAVAVVDEGAQPAARRGERAQLGEPPRRPITRDPCEVVRWSGTFWTLFGLACAGGGLLGAAAPPRNEPEAKPIAAPVGGV